MQRLNLFRSARWLAGLLLVCLFCSLLPTPTPVQAAGPLSQTLLSVADARIQGGSPDVNFGGGYIWIGTANGHLAYVQFDLQELPANATITAAELRLAFQGQYDGAANAELGRNTGPWEEATLTWNNQPTNVFSGITRPVPDDPALVSWNVTGVVQQWYNGTLPNYGFVLRGDGLLKAFHSRETGGTENAPQLVVTYTTPPEEGVRSDFGDAPDSSNSLGVNPNTAYSGVAGNFPTVWAGTPAGQAAGPRHANQRLEGILGDALSREQDADTGADADGINNILNGGADNANNDRGDDGWRNRSIEFRHCMATTLRIRVSKGQNSELNRMFLNVWFDGNRDGDWADRVLCTPENENLAIPAYEWLVQDYFVDMSGIPAGGFVDIDVPTVTVLNTTPGQRHWMRFTLSERRAPQGPNDLADGRGPNPNNEQNSYRFGETEDVLQRPGMPGEDGTLELSKRVISGPQPVDWIDYVDYEIRLRHQGGTQPIQARIRDILPWPLIVAPDVTPNGFVLVDVSSPTGGAAPLTAQYQFVPPSGGTPPRYEVRWQGVLAPDSAVVLRFKVRVINLCEPNQQTSTIINRAEAQPRGGNVITAEDSFEARCAGYTDDAIDLDWEALPNPIDLDDLLGTPTRGEIFNSHPFSVTIGIYETGATGITQDDNSDLLDLIELAPGERRPFTLTLDLDLGTNELELPTTPTISKPISFCFVLPDSDSCLDPEQFPNTHGNGPPVEITPRPNDLGDAPDSTNHAGVAMSAYPGTPAAFPTVFDPATGMPQGPKHAFPRPFHLGERVSREAEADVGPDQDPSNNIEPAANAPNLDVFDDGSRLVNVSHCQPGTAEVRVFISPAAVAWFQQKGTPAYLNAWIDGNRDGDWADGVNCGGSDGGIPAVEHILIDQPINVVALGAGIHNLNFTTGRVPFPANLAEQPTWIRFTLSEEVSNKPLTFGGITYGDGRGYATPFHTGETEDHLRRIENDPQATPDLAVQLNGRIGVGSGQNSSDRIAFRINYANTGTGGARGGTLVFTKPAQLRDLEIVLLRAPGIPPTNIVENAENVTISLPDLPTGSDGTITLGWEAPADQQPAGDYTASVQATINGDSVAENNSASLTLARRQEPPSVAVLAGNGTVWSTTELTCRSNVELRGVSIPGAVFDLWVDGAIRDALQDNDSSWNYSLTGLSDGRHEIYVAPNGATDPGLRSNLLRLRVDSGLPLDPLSLTFTDSSGVVYHPPTLNWQQLGQEIAAYLRNGETYEIGIDSCSDGLSQQITLTLPDERVIELRDDDEDGRYTGSFSLAAPERAALQQTGPMQLSVVGGGISRSFAIALQPMAFGVVRDAVSGQALAGVNVSALGAVGETFIPWPDAALGKANPQPSDANGMFSFSVPNGDNRLQVNHTGYQPYTSWNIATSTGLLVEEIRLSPTVAEAATHTVYITANGYEPALLAVPAGSVIEWVNLDLEEHSVSGAGLASGVLAPGQSFKIRLNTNGSYTFSDEANPLGGGTITVGADQPPPPALRVLLPMIWR
jgi:plastocyanin